MELDRYSLSEVSRIFKIKRPRIQEWLRMKLLFPKYTSPGPGSKAYFSRNDLYCIQLFIELLEFGFNRDDAAFIVQEVQGKLTPRQWTTEPPCNWDEDFLNISKDPSFKEGNKLATDSFKVTYGDPEISHYFVARRKTLDTMPYWQLIIRLNEIKERVDRKLN